MRKSISDYVTGNELPENEYTIVENLIIKEKIYIEHKHKAISDYITGNELSENEYTTINYISTTTV